jgi:hypothetical protein
MFVLLFTLIIVLALIYLINPTNPTNPTNSTNNLKNVEEFLSLNGLNPLRTLPSDDTLQQRYSFNLLPYYNSNYWDFNNSMEDVITPEQSKDFIKFENRKIRRKLLGYNYADDNFRSFSYDLTAEDGDDLIIDPNRTILNDFEAFKPYNYVI